MVKGLEALKHLCEQCHKNIMAQPSKGDLPHKECPWRHISNDYCEEYETVRKNLIKLEELEKAFDALSKDDEKAKKLLSKEIEKNEVLEIIYGAPSIIEQLFKLGQLGKEAEDRYYWGTISDKDVERVKEFFADGKRDQSK